MKKLTTQQVMKALKRLENGWPDDLWIWAGEGGIMLLKKKDGEAVFDFSGRLDQDYIIESYTGIDNDGGGL